MAEPEPEPEPELGQVMASASRSGQQRNTSSRQNRGHRRNTPDHRHYGDLSSNAESSGAVTSDSCFSDAHGDGRSRRINNGNRDRASSGRGGRRHHAPKNKGRSKKSNCPSDSQSSDFSSQGSRPSSRGCNWKPPVDQRQSYGPPLRGTGDQPESHHSRPSSRPSTASTHGSGDATPFLQPVPESHALAPAALDSGDDSQMCSPQPVHVTQPALPSQVPPSLQQSRNPQGNRHAPAAPPTAPTAAPPPTASPLQPATSEPATLQAPATLHAAAVETPATRTDLGTPGSTSTAPSTSILAIFRESTLERERRDSADVMADVQEVVPKRVHTLAPLKLPAALAPRTDLPPLKGPLGRNRHWTNASNGQ